MLLSLTAVLGLLSNDAYNPRGIPDKYVGNGLWLDLCAAPLYVQALCFWLMTRIDQISDLKLLGLGWYKMVQL